VKNHPLFQKMASELAEIRNERKERKEAEDRAAREAERKKMIEEGRQEEALALRDKELEDLKTSHARELGQLNVENKLYAEGFRNRKFLSWAKDDYDGVSDVDDYVATLKADPENAIFMGTPAAPPKPTPPGKPSISGGAMTLDQMRQMEASTDPSVKKQVREFKKQYFDEHGKMPPKL
jgi:hypothetical protein